MFTVFERKCERNKMDKKEMTKKKTLRKSREIKTQTGRIKTPNKAGKKVRSELTKFKTLKSQKPKFKSEPLTNNDD